MSLSLPKDDEDSLIKRSASGDAEAFAQLVYRYQGRVRTYIGSYLHDWPDVVDDLAQEVFLTAFGDIATLRDSLAFGPWLLGIARHRVLRHLRTRVRRGRLTSELLDRGRVEQLEQENAEADLRDRELAIAALQRCLEALPPTSSEVVSEHYFRATSLADISRRMQKGESALRMTLLRIRRALRQCMERRLAEAPGAS